jgi:protein-disulfide isomerase
MVTQWELRSDRLRLGTLLGVQGTPATLIGNQLVPGAISYDELENLVLAELAKQS